MPKTNEQQASPNPSPKPIRKTYEFEICIHVHVDDPQEIETLDHYEGDFRDMETEDISYFTRELREWLDGNRNAKRVELYGYTLNEHET